MNRIALVIGGVALTALLAGCSAGYGYDHGYVSASVGGPVYYDGYYDDYYGPFYDGYWGPDGFFYYSGGRDHPFLRDEGGHFRHEGAAGFHHFQGHRSAGARAGEHRG